MPRARFVVASGLFAGLSVLPYLIPLTQEGHTPPEALASDGRFVEIEGYKHYVRTEGVGRAVLGIPGLGGNVREWDEAFTYLTRDVALTVADPLGYGLSDRPWDADYSHPAQARRLFALLDALGIEQVDLIGHSWGANIAVHMALNQPARVRRLVLLTPGLLRPSSFPLARVLFRLPPLRRAIRIGIHLSVDLERRVKTNYVDPGRVPPDLAERWRPSMETPRWADAYILPLRDSGPNAVRHRLDELHLPILVIFAERDRVFPPESQLPETRKALPQAAIHVIGDAAHHAMIERPSQVYGRVRRFLMEAS